MFTKVLLLGIYAETPMHPGSGVSVNRPIDLPIQRERHTDFPLIQGSSLKGVFRSYARTLKRDNDSVFGPNDIDDIFGSDNSSRAGVISITDARLLLFPVRTLAGVFGWITCPLVLDRFRRDLAMISVKANWQIEGVDRNQAISSQDTSLALNENQIVMEDIRLTKLDEKELGNLKKMTESILSITPADTVYQRLREKMNKDIVVVHDDVFRDLTSLTTEVVARIRINQDTGTADEKALWYEEQLPTDTLLYSLLFISRRHSKTEEILEKFGHFNGSVVQIGGDETVGRGFARLTVVRTC